MCVCVLRGRVWRAAHRVQMSCLHGDLTDSLTHSFTHSFTSEHASYASHWSLFVVTGTLSDMRYDIYHATIDSEPCGLATQLFYIRPR